MHLGLLDGAGGGLRHQLSQTPEAANGLKPGTTVPSVDRIRPRWRHRGLVLKGEMERNGPDEAHGDRDSDRDCVLFWCFFCICFPRIQHLSCSVETIWVNTPVRTFQCLYLVDRALAT